MRREVGLADSTFAIQSGFASFCVRSHSRGVHLRANLSHAHTTSALIEGDRLFDFAGGVADADFAMALGGATFARITDRLLARA